ncbi:MAG TPA: hypothetical protein VGR55_20525 [Candidatus Acidoferrum sp.]|nr:hypothetical protein [Candidatus Acidoferrum sp.]
MKEILPLLRKQRGFLDELLLVTPEKEGGRCDKRVEEQGAAETRSRELYPRLMEIVDKFGVGFLTAKTYKAEYSGSHKVAINATA